MSTFSLCYAYIGQGQIQLKETALESSAKSFLEKEKELVDKIDELEKQVDELNQKSTTFSFNPCQKVSL